MKPIPPITGRRNNVGRRWRDNVARYTRTALWLMFVAGFLVGMALPDLVG